jgi:hypothetical protein
LTWYQPAGTIATLLAELRRFIDLHCRAMAVLAPTLLQLVRSGPIV